MLNTHSFKSNHLGRFVPELLPFLVSFFSVRFPSKRHSENVLAEDSKLFVISILSDLAYHCRDSPSHIPPFFSAFDQLWQQSLEVGDRASQLQLVRFLSLLASLQGVSLSMNAASFLTVVKYVLTDADKDLFLEDGLILWSRTMQLPSIEYTPPVHAIFSILINEYSRDMKNFQSVMTILDAYLCIGKTTFLADYAASLTEIYQTLLRVVSARDFPRLITSMHMLLVLFPTEGCSIIGRFIDTMFQSLSSS